MKLMIMLEEGLCCSIVRNSVTHGITNHPTSCTSISLNFRVTLVSHDAKQYKKCKQGIWYEKRLLKEIRKIYTKRKIDKIIVPAKTTRFSVPVVET